MPGGNSTARPLSKYQRKAVLKDEGYEGEREFFSGQAKRQQKQRDARSGTQKLIVKSRGLYGQLPDITAGQSDLKWFNRND